MLFVITYLEQNYINWCYKSKLLWVNGTSAVDAYILKQNKHIIDLNIYFNAIATLNKNASDKKHRIRLRL